MNNINLIGRLTRDPELRCTGSQKPVANMRLAVPRRDRDAAPVYVDVAAFDKLAELCSEHLEKGRQVAVTGRLEYSEWETEGAQKRSAHSVIASDVDFLGSKPTNGSDDGEQRPAPQADKPAQGDDEDIPF